VGKASGQRDAKEGAKWFPASFGEDTSSLSRLPGTTKVSVSKPACRWNDHRLWLRGAVKRSVRRPI